MDIKQIQDLIRFVSKSGVNEVSIEQNEFKITIKTNQAPTFVTANVPAAAPAQPVAAPAIAASAPEQAPAAAADHHRAHRRPVAPRRCAARRHRPCRLCRADRRGRRRRTTATAGAAG